MSRGIVGTLELEEYVSSGQVLCVGFRDVELMKEKEERRFSPELLAVIEAAWLRHLQSNPHDYNGCMGSIVSFSLSKDKLTIKFREGSFAEFYATQARRPEFLNVHSGSLDEGTCLPLSFGAVAVTRPSPLHPTGCIVFATRGETTFDEGRITLLPGGYFDPSKDYIRGEKGKIYSIKVTVLRELFEELRVSRYESIRFLGLVYNNQGSRQPLLALFLNLPFTAEELEKITGNAKEEEVKQIFFVDNDVFAVKEFLRGKKLAIHDAWKLLLFFQEDT